MKVRIKSYECRFDDYIDQLQTANLLYQVVQKYATIDLSPAISLPKRI